MLKPQQVHIPFVTGLNQSVDEKIAPEGTLARASNIRFDRAGRIVKRGAYRNEGGTALGEARGVIGSELSAVVVGDGMIHRSSLSEGQPTASWTPLGFMPRMHVERDFAPTDADPSQLDSAEWWSAEDYGIGVVVWYEEDNETDLNYVVYDARTGDRFGSGLISASLTSFGGVRVVSVPDGIYAVYADDTGSGYDFFYSYIAGNSGYLGSMSVGMALTNSATEVGDTTDSEIAPQTWDACSTNSGFVLAFQATGATHVRFVSYQTVASAPTEQATNTSTISNAVTNLSLCRNVGVGTYFWAAARDGTTTSIVVSRIHQTTLASSSPRTLRSSSYEQVGTLGGCHISGEKTFWTWGEGDSTEETTALFVYWFYWAEVDTDTGGSVEGPYRRPNLWPQARPFVVNGSAFSPTNRRNPIFLIGSVTYTLSIASSLSSDGLLGFPTTDTPNYDGASQNECTIAAVLTTGVQGFQNTTRARNTTPDALGRFVFHAYDRSLGVLKYDGGASGLDLSATSFEGNLTRWVASAGAADGLYAAPLTLAMDGHVAVLDSREAHELTHLAPPQIVGTDKGSGSGSLTSGATYQFVCVWEWYSGGVRYQSEPSIPESVTLGGSDTYVDLYVAHLAAGTIGQAAGYAGKELVVYRSTENGGGNGIFYRIKNALDSEGVTPASNTTPYALFEVRQDDTYIVGNEVLYTASSLPNQCVPGGTAHALHKSRLWTGGGLDPFRIYYSHPASQGLPPRFNLAMYLDVPTSSRVTALASAGDVLAVFTQDAIYAVLGDGPNTLGEPVDGFRVQLVASGIGATGQVGVVETPDGVMFMSSAGLRLLSRGLEVLPFGEQVREFFHPVTGGTCVGAAFCRGDETTCFAMSADTPHVVVYDHTHRVWSVDYPAELSGQLVGAADLSGRFMLCDDDGLVYRYDSTQNQDTQPGSSSQFLMDIETVWLKMGEFTGFKRLMWVHLLGERDGSCPVNVEVTTGYTDGSTNKTTHSWTAADIAALDHFELRAHLKYQRGSAFKVRVAEQAGVSPNAGFQANALGLIYGVRGTLTKMGTEASK